MLYCLWGGIFGTYDGGMTVDINAALNEILVKLFRNITVIEERSLKRGEYKNVTVNDMHVIEASGIGEPKNMTAVAKTLAVTCLQKP